MRTVRIKLCTFSELNEKAKQNAISNHRESPVFHDWAEPIEEQFTDELPQKGFRADEVHYSGFWSQGDGAMFIGKVIDFNKFTNGVKPLVKKLIEAGLIEFTCKIEHSGRYFHENSAHYYFDWYSDNSHNRTYSRLTDELSKVENNIREAYQNICRELYQQLEKSYSALTSDEAVAEYLTVNEYEFYQDGSTYMGDK